MSEEASIRTAAAVRSQAAGKARREALPRKSLGQLADRPAGFDPVALLEAQATTRIPSLVPLRYQRMALDEFSFLRGSAASMAYDLALSPSTGIDVQLCGDAHVANFGAYLSPERRLVFDVNDFDETLPGPFEWDLKRLVASAAVALGGQGVAEKVIADVVLAAVGVYRTTVVELAGKGNLDVWYAAMDIEAHLTELRELFGTKNGSPVDDLINRAKRSSSKRAFQKLTTIENGRLSFRPDPPVVVPLSEILVDAFRGIDTRDVIETAMAGYRESLLGDRAYLLRTFESVDMARKVVGVGSVGTRCFVILLLGKGTGDPLILQVKEASGSVLESHLGPSGHENAGQRVVAGQRLMQTTSDIFLGYTRVAYSPTESHDFYVRQFHDGKASVDLSGVIEPKLFGSYLAICAWTLARAHARSGDRVEAAAYLGSSDVFDRAMADWALAYLQRNREDYTLFTDAIASGRLDAKVPAVESSPPPVPDERQEAGT
jgi:hypothetical protein